nr:hypothetical protein [uncultured Sphaerochaeta sp.]
MKKNTEEKLHLPGVAGMKKLNPRMQYTASSFADELNSISKSVLVYDKKSEHF